MEDRVRVEGELRTVRRLHDRTRIDHAWGGDARGGTGQHQVDVGRRGAESRESRAVVDDPVELRTTGQLGEGPPHGRGATGRYLFADDRVGADRQIQIAARDVHDRGIDADAWRGRDGASPNAE